MLPSSISSNPSTSRVRPQQYLLVYNLVSAIAWAAVLARVILLIPLVGYQNLYGGVGEFVRWVQTGAALEIVHSALGTCANLVLLDHSLQIPLM